jgi:site-specific DNA-methyltransferase (adenine-specific)
MNIDVVIGNPPYHQSDGGYGRSAVPLYHHFVELAKQLNPRSIVMVIPAKWYTGGRGLGTFRRTMLNDHRIQALYDIPDASDWFPGTQIEGGICYFRWSRDYRGLCTVTTIADKIRSVCARPLLVPGLDMFIRYNQALPIVEKVRRRGEPSFATIVRSSNPFGLRSFYRGRPEPFSGAVTVYQYRSVGYTARSSIRRNEAWIDAHKVFISAAYGSGTAPPYRVLNRPIIAGPGSVCTETYLCIGPFQCVEEARAAAHYLTTRFVRFLVLLAKSTQQAKRNVYRLVPMQDFRYMWTDDLLYQKYGLSDEDIAFIETMVRPIERPIE